MTVRRMECQACGMVDVTGMSHPKAGPGPARRCHGPVVAVEYVPASQLRGAVAALATVAKPGGNTSALVNAAGYARGWLVANGHPDPWRQ